MENRQLDILIERYPILAPCRESIQQAYEMLKEMYYNGGKLLVCGNGGSCADAEHLVSELMKGFCKLRPIPDDLRQKIIAEDPVMGEAIANDLECGLMAIALSAHSAFNYAFENDKTPDFVFAQEVMSYGNPGDIFMGITTSGNSDNVIYALEVAKAKGLGSIILTGRTGGKIAGKADVTIYVPEDECHIIQELHLPVYHAICLMLEDEFFES